MVALARWLVLRVAIDGLRPSKDHPEPSSNRSFFGGPHWVQQEKGIIDPAIRI
jgi:hypothetical protein